MAFLVYNFEAIQYQQWFLAIVEGLRFDISALLYLNLAFFIALLLHSFWKTSTNFKGIINGLFYTINIPFILLNNIDIPFYEFNLKRSTADFFDAIFLTDLSNVYTDYIWDYWPISILSISQVVVLFSLKSLPSYSKVHVGNVLPWIISVILLIIGLRGGTQLKPIKPIHAGLLTESHMADAVLNTPFCLLHSFQQKQLEPLNYLENIDPNLYSTQHFYNHNTFKANNVVVIILESFSKEFIGHYHSGKGYTPFLDSLLSTGLSLENAYANGVRSIEALPAITSSIPSLMQEPFITTPYANHYYQSLASILVKKGYSSSFFHGGQKGTMGFYEFSKKAGYQNYYGREEYPNDSDYDQHWGIYDHAFFQYFAEELNKSKVPFVSTFFSLSSHPPYAIPKAFSDQFPKGELDIHQSIAYTDFALQKFFHKAQQMDWFDQTLFVITADHTSPLSNNRAYQNKVGRYAIPLLFWKADGSLKGTSNIISQHIDILPSVLDILGYPQTFFSFGKSIYEQKSWAISFHKNHYMLITDSSYIVNNEEVYQTYNDKEFKQKINNQTDHIKLLKAIKQEFNNRVRTNTMYENDH